MPDATEPRTGGIWALSDGAPIIVEPDGPATLLVPGESVLLLAVDLPLASHGKRRDALPFAIEDRIADPIESVHLAIGQEIAPKRYLVGVVRHALMREWVEAAAAAGLDRAAMVPDALALPAPDAGEWNAEAQAGRVVVRAGDGTGFVLPMALLGQAWAAAGEPRIWNCGGLPLGEVPHEPRVPGGGGLAMRMAAPALDLRQGLYARQGAAPGRWLKRFAWVAAAGVAAHVLIATADTVMLKVIAERRAADLRTAVAQAAPGTSLSGDLASTVIDMLPTPGPAASTFLPLVTRSAQALAPLSSAVAARSMRFEGNALQLDLIPAEPGLADRVREALRAAGVTADVADGADGTVRVTVRA